ncbi:aminodeoxychorismate synthase component 1 [bacterium BMS3Bbin12]|nr:aminodeoxychorismate synthase component 1 [bacterium BMS3Bbin12]GBE51274.1 aminodeoxychorismate synthase component 1 [bacterium BMS3Bbin13]
MSTRAPYGDGTAGCAPGHATASAPGVDLLALHRRNPSRYPFLLESVAAGTPQARFDLLLAFPGARLILHADGILERPAGIPAGSDFLGALDHWWRAWAAPAGDPASAALPFHGGWFLYLGYELVGQIEPGLDLPPPPPGLPVALAVRTPAAVIRDRVTGRVHLVAEPGSEALLEELRRDLEAPGPVPEPPDVLLDGPLTEDPPRPFLEGVGRIRRYIREGDVFQATLSREWRGALASGTAPWALYERLRRCNPAPFAALALCGEEEALVCSSPERLVSVRGRRVETRPIAGTHPRAVQSHADRRSRRRLLAHPKERAEHIMLVDLERNDLGRVCRYGSVRVRELMALESYAHVHHIVSAVEGELRAGVTPGEVIRAVFPGGTITGCPKVRCVEIIAELERAGRGAYTGSIGYLDRSGDLDLNILIRTMVQHGRTVSLRAGAGIVADSVPERELEETRHKARGLALALARATPEASWSW